MKILFKFQNNLLRKLYNPYGGRDHLFKITKSVISFCLNEFVDSQILSSFLK